MISDVYNNNVYNNTDNTLLVGEVGWKKDKGTYEPTTRAQEVIYVTIVIISSFLLYQKELS